VAKSNSSGVGKLAAQQNQYQPTVASVKRSEQAVTATATMKSIKRPGRKAEMHKKVIQK